METFTALPASDSVGDALKDLSFGRRAPSRESGGRVIFWGGGGKIAGYSPSFTATSFSWPLRETCIVTVVSGRWLAITARDRENL